MNCVVIGEECPLINDRKIERAPEIEALDLRRYQDADLVRFDRVVGIGLLCAVFCSIGKMYKAA